ncbi:MBL fold metallo-hydrolase [Candidatus Micrarchaeota archaeon]|nr:MBL fold metallo-hydrolase [Candidatus Micrarchaeota archaeon]
MAKIKHSKGLMVEETVIDASVTSLKKKNFIITHAHSDHAKISSSKEKTFFLTPETKALIETRNKKEFNSSEIPFGKKFSLDGKEFEFFFSGHILGSSQIKVNSGEIVFTSDFRLSDSVLFEGAKVLQAETLVIESTYGKPEFVFPKRKQIYEQIEAWGRKELKENNLLVLGGYSIGKAQELTKISNAFFNEVPLVHQTVFGPNNVYKEKGVKLGKFELLNHNLKEFNVLIIPPHLLNLDLIHAIEISSGRKVSPAVFSGWNSFAGAKTFPLSDHADFNDLLKYVEFSGAKNVLTHHGFAKEFASFIKRRLGINARALSEDSQSSLLDF